jgi:hypothetical protein
MPIFIFLYKNVTASEFGNFEKNLNAALTFYKKQMSKAP